MARSKTASIVAISGSFLKDGMELLTFLTLKFPHIDQEIWEDRFSRELILSMKNSPVLPSQPVTLGERYQYFREVVQEKEIPFHEEVLFQNEHFIVASKPHFLPVTPTGPYIHHCLVNRLRYRFGNNDINPINRIDRLTAGLVLLSCNRETAGLYKQMFVESTIEKEYLAGSEIFQEPVLKSWHVENRLERSGELFLMHAVEGETNAISDITFLEKRDELGIFSVKITTGKQHQIRVHMSGLGFPLKNDNFYPTLLPKEMGEDFTRPLKLIAKRISFTDPLTGERLTFESPLEL